MKSSINKELDILEKIINNHRNKTNIIEMLDKALNIKLSDFKYKGIIYLKRIIEYDFSIIKIVGIYKDEIFNFYIKIIKGGEIKKSVFCCWSLLQEEYEDTFKNQKDTFQELIVNKVTIKDNSCKKFRKSVSLKTEGDICFNFEVNFIELKGFLEKFQIEFIEELKNFNIINNGIILIMVTKEKR